MTTEREIKAAIEEVLKQRQKELEAAYYQAALRRFARIEAVPSGHEIRQRGQETIKISQVTRPTSIGRSIA